MLTNAFRKATYSNSFSNCVEARWAKSSHSYSDGHCVEARWRKSSRSESNGHCAEARTAGGLVQVRDSKDPGPVLSFTPADWDAFLNGIKAPC